MKGRLTIFKTKQNAFLLTAFATVCTLLVALTNLWTAPVIERQKQQQILKQFNQVLSTELYDNNPLFDCVMLQDPVVTGVNSEVAIYRAKRSNDLQAMIYQTRTQQGYNGLIELLVAIDNKGVVQGVRTIAHQETPGLGDKIELAKSDWILEFNGESVSHAKDNLWYVKKDGGKFDQFTGATITPRAIVNQLRTSIDALNHQFESLSVAPNDCAETTQQAATTTEQNTQTPEAEQ